jgi:hypothetical protein
MTSKTMYLADPMDNTNIAFKSTVLMFIGVNGIRYMVSTFSFWLSPSYDLLRRDF